MDMLTRCTATNQRGHGRRRMFVFASNQPIGVVVGEWSDGRLCLQSSGLVLEGCCSSLPTSSLSMWRGMMVAFVSNQQGEY